MAGPLAEAIGGVETFYRIGLPFGARPITPRNPASSMDVLDGANPPLWYPLLGFAEASTSGACLAPGTSLLGYVLDHSSLAGDGEDSTET